MIVKGGAECATPKKTTINAAKNIFTWRRKILSGVSTPSSWTTNLHNNHSISQNWLCFFVSCVNLTLLPQLIVVDEMAYMKEKQHIKICGIGGWKSSHANKSKIFVWVCPVECWCICIATILVMSYLVFIFIIVVVGVFCFFFDVFSTWNKISPLNMSS